MRQYIRLLRPKHYVKNALVFAALVCSGRLLEHELLFKTAAAFAAFCAMASFIYIINDIWDAPRDRLSETKKNRPIASGAVTVRSAAILATVLFILAVGLGASCYEPRASMLLAAYLLLNLGYCFGLKDEPLVDIAILASGFLIRVLYGAAVCGIQVSGWLSLTVIALSFFCALGKRRAEASCGGGASTRAVLGRYPKAFLDRNMYVCMALANVFYALWTMDAQTTALYQTKHLVYTTPLVMLITLKYSYDIENGEDGDPVELVFQDHGLLVMCLVFLSFMTCLLYIPF